MANSAGISRRKTILFLAILGILVLGLQEVVMRLAFPIPEVVNFNRIRYSRTQYSQMPAASDLEQSGPLANATYLWTSDPDHAESVHKLNIYGFRDKTWPVERSDDRCRVMFVGDSFVEGFLANEHETIPKGFEQAAASSSTSVETLNLGVGASGVDDYFPLIRDAVPLFRPDQLVLVFFANDCPFPPYNAQWLDTPLTPKRSSWSVPRLYYCVDRLIQGRTIATSFGSKPFPFLPVVPDPRNPWSESETRRSFEEFVSPQLAASMTKGRFNCFLVNGHTMFKQFLVCNFDAMPHLSALRAFLDRYSTELLIVYLPSRQQVSDAYLQFVAESDIDKTPDSLMGDQYQGHARILAGACKELSVPFLDLTPVLRRAEKEGHRLYWDYDDHMKGEGYLLVGQHIFRSHQFSDSLTSLAQHGQTGKAIR